MSLPVKTVVVSNAERRSSMMAGCTGRSSLGNSGKRLSSSRLLRCVLDCAPDLLRCKRHIDRGDAVFGQGVQHGVDDHAQAAGASGFATALGAERIRFGRRGMV